jgi:hypothetical protein
MEAKAVEIIQLELKYCERCGGLWLRVKGDPETYCAACALAVSDFAIQRRSSRLPRLPVKNLDHRPGCDLPGSSPSGDGQA